MTDVGIFAIRALIFRHVFLFHTILEQPDLFFHLFIKLVFGTIVYIIHRDIIITTTGKKGRFTRRPVFNIVCPGQEKQVSPDRLKTSGTSVQHHFIQCHIPVEFVFSTALGIFAFSKFYGKNINGIPALVCECRCILMVLSCQFIFCRYWKCVHNPVFTVKITEYPVKIIFQYRHFLLVVLIRDCCITVMHVTHNCFFGFLFVPCSLDYCFSSSRSEHRGQCIFDSRVNDHCRQIPFTLSCFMKIYFRFKITACMAGLIQLWGRCSFCLCFIFY